MFILVSLFLRRVGDAIFLLLSLLLPKLVPPVPDDGPPVDDPERVDQVEAPGQAGQDPQGPGRRQRPPGHQAVVGVGPLPREAGHAFRSQFSEA